MWTATCQSAAAIDLTGTWQGEFKCNVYVEDGTKPVKVTDATSMLISQSGVSVNVLALGLPGSGTAIDNGANEAKGLVAFNTCPGLEVAYHANGKATIPANDAKLTLDLILFREGSIGYCTVKVERTATGDPGVGPCSGG